MVLSTIVGCWGGLDLGATTWRFRWTNDLGMSDTYTGSTADFTSIEALLEHIFKLMGGIPEALCMAMSGALIEGAWESVNIPCPAFTRSQIAVRFSIDVSKLEFINDMQGAHAGGAVVDRSLLTPLKPGTADPSRNLCVLTLSSGENHASGPAGQLAMAREGGHIRLALPYEDDHATVKMAQFASRQLGRPASAENLLGGIDGPRLAFEFLFDQYGSTIPQDLREVYFSLKEQGKGHGQWMTEGALEGDPILVETAYLYGKLLAYLLHQITVGDLVGELLIQGSVLNGTENFGTWLFATRFMKRILAESGMALDESVAAQVTIYGVPTRLELGLEGAHARARRMVTWIGRDA